MSAPAPATNAYASASLYVGDLASDVAEALLFEIFNAVGPVASVRVCRDAATRRSLGYAYVNFHRVEDADRALDTMNYTNIRNRPCRIMWSHRDPSLRKSGQGNIFVKNLARSIDNKTLYDTFSMFGNILSCKVAVNSKRESLGYGFVHYESDEAAQLAITRVDGMVIANQKVSVQPFKSKRERGGLDKSKFTNVYAKDLPEDMGKDEMDELFRQFGQITSSMISIGEDGKSRGFGFINFANPEEAATAVEQLNQREIRGKTLYVARAQKKEEREKEQNDRFEQQKRQKQYAGVNLYVKNLADNVDDSRLRQEFAKFGDISSAKVMRDPATDKSRGFGFVCFATPEEATKAVTEMNSKMLDGKPVYVALAQRKEVRRAQLEAQYAARAQRGMTAPAGPMYAQGPMFYAPPVQGMPQRMVYPQQMGMPRQPRWNPQAQRQPAPQMMGHPMYNIGGMPMNGRGAGPQGNGGGRQRGQNQGFKYTANVRNREAAQGAQSQAGSMPQASPQVMLAAQAPLTIQALAAAPDEQQKQMIGERLFPLIQQQEPQLAGKITGMLLEMDNGELLHLLESAEARNDKIQEALLVLHQHSETQDEGVAV